MSKTKTLTTTERIAALEDEQNSLIVQRDAAHEQLKALDRELPGIRAAAVRQPGDEVQQAVQTKERERYDQQNTIERLEAAIESIKADLDAARVVLERERHDALKQQIVRTLSDLRAACDELDRNWEDSAAIERVAGLIKQYHTLHRAYVAGLPDGQPSEFPKVNRLDIAYQNRIAHLAHELFTHADFGRGGLLQTFRGRRVQPAATFREAFRIEDKNNGN